MKYIVSFAIALLYSVCSANSATTVVPQQSWNAIISDSNVNIDHQSTISTNTVCVPNQVTFSTQHKSLRHHSPNPQYDLHRMNTKQLEWYFSVNHYTEAEILSHPMLYMNQAYLAIAKQLPRYPEFVEKYYNRYSTYKGLYAIWKIVNFRYRDGMREKFAELYQECENQRFKERARKHREREERAKKEAALAYYTKLESINHDELMLDAIPHQHQQTREKACAQIKTSAPDRIVRKFTVTQDTVTFAHAYGIAEQDLTSLQGNTYEQQLHIEFLEQLTEARTITIDYALQPKNILIDAVGHGAALGIEANRLQQPDIATAWANFGWQALEIIKGIGDGLLLCVENTAHCIQDPKHALTEFVHALGNITGYCARAIGTGMRWHELMEQGDYLLMAQEMDDVANKIALCGTLCADKLSTLSAREIAKNVTYVATDIAITHKMLMFGSHLCSELKPILFDLIKHIRKEEALVEFALQSTEEFGNAGKISLLMEETEANSVKNALFSTAQQSSAETIWTSKGGLIYGPDKKFGTRINHVLQHTKPNTSKLNHTVFTMTGDKLFDLIDFAWSKRGIALVDDPGSYIIELEKIIGTQGEQAMKIVVIPGTNQLITAYPVKV